MKRSAKYKESEYRGEKELTAEGSMEVCQGILPPGVEKYHEDVYGTFRMAIGNITWLNNAINYDNIKMKLVFWGEDEAPFLLRGKNTCLDELGVVYSEARYQVR
jgi:hypothetical protein